MFDKPKNDAPPGFSLLTRYPLVDEEPTRIEIILPSALRDELVELDKQEQRRRDEERRRAREAGDAGSAARKKVAEANVQALLDSVVDDEDRELEPGVDYDPLELMPVYPRSEVAKLREAKSSKSWDRDAKERLEVIARKLDQRTNLRKVGAPLVFAGDGQLRALKRSHPHFGEVIDLIENQIILAQAAKSRLSIPPILLWGPPGVGKTHFAQELGEILGTSVRRLSYDTEMTGAALLGSDKKWSSSTHGAVFEAVCLGEHANPVMLLDEVDKAYRGPTDSDPLASLHSLLEPVSSQAVTDISLDFTFDASAVIWICTANDPRKVAPTLRSRMREFLIQMPDAAQCLQIAESVGDSICASMAVEGLAPPAKRITSVLAHLTPREQSQALRQAYARAITGGRLALRLDDIPRAYLDDVGASDAGQVLH